MDNKFNTIETIIKDYLDDDTDVKAIAKKVHEKLKADIRKYGKHETPAVAVHCTGFSGRRENPHVSTINVFIEIVDSGGDLETVDGRVKQLQSIIIDKLRAESPLLGGGGIDEQLESIFISDAAVIPWDAAHGFLISGNINMEVEIVE